MVRPTEAELRKVRLQIASLRDRRCRAVDSDGCRCLRADGHAGPHDQAYTPWELKLRAQQAQP